MKRYHDLRMQIEYKPYTFSYKVAILFTTLENAQPEVEPYINPEGITIMRFKSVRQIVSNEVSAHAFESLNFKEEEFVNVVLEDISHGAAKNYDWGEKTRKEFLNDMIISFKKIKEASSNATIAANNFAQLVDAKPAEPNVSLLADKLPGMDHLTMCPAMFLEKGTKHERDCIYKMQTGTLKNIVMHLNDDHKWDRNRIADWLDRLHDEGKVDLSVKTLDHEPSA